MQSSGSVKMCPRSLMQICNDIIIIYRNFKFESYIIWSNICNVKCHTIIILVLQNVLYKGTYVFYTFTVSHTIFYIIYFYKYTFYVHISLHVNNFPPAGLFARNNIYTVKDIIISKLNIRFCYSVVILLQVDTCTMYYIRYCHCRRNTSCLSRYLIFIYYSCHIYFLLSPRRVGDKFRQECSSCSKTLGVYIWHDMWRATVFISFLKTYYLYIFLSINWLFKLFS